MMLAALNAASKAKNLVFIGSSLRSEDQFLTVLMTHFLHQRGWQGRHIVVVSPAAREVCKRIKRYWGVNVSRQVRPVARPIETAVDELLSVIA
jgi:hypothetical protein